MLQVFLFALVVMLLDQLSKYIVSSRMIVDDSIELIDGFFDIFYTRNDGIAWGVDVKLWILILITIVAITIFVILSRKLKWKNDKWYIITLGFMFGGTLGNFVDRIFQKDHSVIDFLSFDLYYPSFKDGFHFNVYYFPIFNIADTFLVVGAIMFIIYLLFIEPKKSKLALKSEEKEEQIEKIEN